MSGDAAEGDDDALAAQLAQDAAVGTRRPLPRRVTAAERTQLNAALTKGASWDAAMASLPSACQLAGRDATRALLRLPSGAFVEVTLRDERIVRLEAHEADAAARVAARQLHTLGRLVEALALPGQAVVAARARLHATLGGLGPVVRQDRGATSYALERHPSGVGVVLVEQAGYVIEARVVGDDAADVFAAAVRDNVVVPLVPAGQA